ncbi:MAG: hypothetical protein KUA37_11890 [Desulfomicrobium sp.]|jgi:lactate dehydrogenase-like 2-hydroxyacid dehydrogenase|uniref:NAD(P)-dependent oxidoreductase n=1 Tax=Hoeflea sp. TaxID=1940281 RepID=UPI0025BBE919|nr:NAD(P)-dependent oxidoreductase [Hoeflea sp.]MBU4529368.1 phosphoglycerate dehydrogenase [Alphaproteobacteria bacterium]MBV1712684.1 hypothetical protein [Desulfomicrobium sp.]MBU4545039.1 phosphoglycerate dehydrogenase [Alphaproteobacteria bacterium]MBU4552446.1 phosphoglycerate dehydrogenase [Alphaproteobacteria bacterium]MBV1783597.1 phosphoglycerate dehydrogenase [Hoeflea sp.]
MYDTDARRTYRILICDLVGLRPGPDGRPDCSEVRRHVEQACCTFHDGDGIVAADIGGGGIHFVYRPDLNTAEDLVAEAGDGLYDAVIAAATVVPADTVFPEGGVRIGAGTGNMHSRSWGGGSGAGGAAPLMNTPGINSRATAQMVMKAILRFLPDLPFDLLHECSVSGRFDTGRDLKDFPTGKLEGRRIAVLGYGNIGREVARLADAFRMRPVIYARERHRRWIEAEGFRYAATPVEASAGADIVSVHLGLGAADATTGRFANAGLVGDAIFDAVSPGATLVNFDRGELVDAAALDTAMGDGRIRFAAIDADIFRDAATGAVSGPLAPYLPLVERHAGRLLVLPHAVADTDHPSRVAGAKQAVDQILEAIRFGRVGNLKGDLPDGYTAVPGRAIHGIGGVSAGTLAGVAEDADVVKQFADMAGRLHDFWTRLAAAADAEERQALCAAMGDGVMLDVNRQAALIGALGLHGPFTGKPRD